MNRIYSPVRRLGMLVFMIRRRESIGCWRKILRRQAESGLSVAAFCGRSRIPQGSFYAWRRKLRDLGSFTEVRVAPESAPSASALQLVLLGGRSIMVGPGFDRTTLLALVDALERGTAHGGAAESGA